MIDYMDPLCGTDNFPIASAQSVKQFKVYLTPAQKPKFNKIMAALDAKGKASGLQAKEALSKGHKKPKNHTRPVLVDLLVIILAWKSQPD